MGKGMGLLSLKAGLRGRVRVVEFPEENGFCDPFGLLQIEPAPGPASSQEMSPWHLAMAETLASRQQIAVRSWEAK